MPLISPDYAEQNRLLHEQRRHYGANGGRYREHVYALIMLYRPDRIIDFGCGKGNLQKTVRDLVEARKDSRFLQRSKLTKRERRHNPAQPYMPEWIEYDPGIPGKDTLPEEQADLLVCTDVLEHVEPECIGDVMDTIARLARRAAFLTFSLRESDKTLPDGRNTHLIVEGRNYWKAQMERAGFKPVDLPWKNAETYIALAVR